MENANKLREYNSEVINWNFEKKKEPEFLRLLSERNLFIFEHTPLIDFCPCLEIPSRNEAVIDHNKIVAPEYIGFHIGYLNQKRLYSLIDEKTNAPNNVGVFFSLKPNDVAYFLDFNDKPDLMVYFLDSAFAKGPMVQINYKSSAISRNDLDDLIKRCDSEDKQLLSEEHRHLNEMWMKQNTIPFDISKKDEYEENNYDWLIVPDPIDIKY
jgi:hypothetical protein